MKRARFVDSPDGVWHTGLGCFIEAICIDCVERRATLFLRRGSCTDMQGAIALVTGIDPRVTRIYSRGGGDRDTCYEKRGETWTSFRPVAQVG